MVIGSRCRQARPPSCSSGSPSKRAPACAWTPCSRTSGPTSAGRNTLQSKVSQLRRALGDKDLVVGEDDTYRLAVEPDDVDAIRRGRPRRRGVRGPARR